MIEINLIGLLKAERGAKKEWKTVTRGGRTFRQRFATGEKESESTGVTMGIISDTKPEKWDAINYIKSLGWDARHSNFCTGYISDKAHVFMEGKVVVAVCDFNIKNNILELDMLEVNPYNRRQGKGVETMKNIVQHAIDNNIEKIKLESMNESSDKFYGAIGMSDLGKSKFPGRALMTCYEGDQEWMKAFITAK